MLEGILLSEIKQEWKMQVLLNRVLSKSFFGELPSDNFIAILVDMCILNV